MTLCIYTTLAFNGDLYGRIGPDGIIKVADFGLTEDMYSTNYFRRRKSVTGGEEKVPIRWMAPESIAEDIYNESTDVVSAFHECKICL